MIESFYFELMRRPGQMTRKILAQWMILVAECWLLISMSSAQLDSCLCWGPGLPLQVIALAPWEGVRYVVYE